MTEVFNIIQAGEVYGLYHYMSRFSSALKGNKTAGSDSSKVYNFKKFGTHADEIKKKIEAVSQFFGCEKIVACPAHVPDDNELQQLFGKTIERTKEVVARKYNHKADIDIEKEAATIVFPDDFKYRRVLLVDDICTTGKTLRFYRVLLKTLGIECVLFSLGISEKLEPKKCDVQLVFEKEDPKSVLQRSREHEDDHVAIDKELDFARKKIDWPRRNAAEKSFAAWLKEYGIGVFIDDEPSPHLYEVINAIEDAGNDSRPVQILIARGHGKTSFAEAYMAYCFCTGKRKLGVVSSINANQAQQILKDVTRIFPDSKFVQDYPDIALPIALLDGHGRRSQRQGGHDTNVRMVTDTVQFPTITNADGTASAASGACIKAKALKSVRGTKNGTQRPDVAVLDDLQTREIAENPERVADVLSLIRGDVMGLAGKQKLAVIMLATTIAADDVTEQLREDKAWRTVEFKAIIKWPDEWKKPDHGLWGEYYQKFDEENTHNWKHTRKDGSLKFYKEHKAEMDAGADILNWDNFDRKQGQISGLQKLLDSHHQMGHEAFMAEYQMEPQRHAAVVNAAPNIIVSRVRKGVAPGSLIENSVFTACATDINPSYGFTCLWQSWDVMKTFLIGGARILPVRINDASNDTEYQQAVFSGLVAVANWVKSIGVPFNKWGIDASGKQWQAVTRFANVAQSQYGVDAVAMTGRAGKNWNPNVGSRIREARNGTVLCRDRQTGFRFMAFDADAHKESYQRSFLTEVGGVGGGSICDGGLDLTELAIQLTNEKLLDKRPIAGGLAYAYNWRSKDPHDYLDCGAMLDALAASEGINGDGRGPTVSKHKRRVYVG